MKRLAILLTLWCAAQAAAQPLHRGAWETGLSLSWTSVDGDTQASVFGRVGAYPFHLGPGLIGTAVQAGYLQRSSLKSLETVLSADWHLPLGSLFGDESGAAGTVGTVGATYGLLNDWVGGFSQTQHLAGGQVGLLAFASRRAALRTEYQYRHIFTDVGEDYSEHRFIGGVSIFWNND